MYQRIVVLMVSIFLFISNCIGQNISSQLEIAIQKLSIDEQCKHAIISLYITDSKTGSVIFDKNSQVGLSPASCQKIVTSVSTFELLGSKFQFKTYIGYNQPVIKGVLEGNLYLSGRGDPTLGSNRWKTTSEAAVLKKILNSIQKNKIQSVAGSLVCDDSYFTNEPIPTGWVWEDIGNYYGAGAWGLNWRENQFDVTFKTSKVLTGNAEIISTNPASIISEYGFINFVTTGSRESGDNAFLFSSPYHKKIIARGTVPMSENGFTISGSMPDPPMIFIKEVKSYVNENGISIAGEAISKVGYRKINFLTGMPTLILDSILSPSLDSINYWFLKKSVNLFGEAFVKMIAFQKSNQGATDTGISIIKEFWNKQGIEKSALKMIDGSGLSPANRVTTHALVTVLQYAKWRPWFASFYNALPETNGIKMKDGYINGVRSYTGFLKNKNGQGFTFSFIVNNFDGNPGSIREKMWKVLDLLK